MTTTAQIIQNNRVKVYENLYIKRRYLTGYESSWYDISDYLMAASSGEISQLLDFDSYGFGEFKSANASFMLDNDTGKFLPPDDLYSFFHAALTRHFTKVQYRAGYRDVDGTKIDELVFEGLWDDASVQLDFLNSTIRFMAFSYNQVFYQKTVPAGLLSGSATASAIISSIVQNSTVSGYISYDSAQVNPGTNRTFDDSSQYNNRKYADVLDAICKRTNSVWYVDQSTLTLVVRSRNENTNPFFNFIGGYSQTANTNILKLNLYDEGQGKIINNVVYNNSAGKTQYSADTDLLAKYPAAPFTLEGDELTSTTTIAAVCNEIIDEFKVPRKRLIIQTIYAPNILDLFDVATVAYTQKPVPITGRTQMVFNGGGKWNNSEVWGAFKSGLRLDGNTKFKVVGWKHNVAEGTTDWYLIETGRANRSSSVGTGTQLVWNKSTGKFNASQTWNGSL